MVNTKDNSERLLISADLTFWQCAVGEGYGKFFGELSLVVTGASAKMSGFAAQTAGLSAIRGRTLKKEQSWRCCHTKGQARRWETRLY